MKVDATWTYHRDSELHTGLGSYRYGSPSNQSTESKTKLIAWMASNCDGSNWPRTTYVRELKKYIQVDAYGICGNLSCPRDTGCNLNTYKFYLSFENSECEDYITEKCWRNALLNGVVPVVYGARKESYEKFAPPNSFIYAGDFDSPKSLAKYITKLDQQPDLYSQYFEWRKKGSLDFTYKFSPHMLCSILPVIDQQQKGELKKKPLSSHPWFTSCRYGTFVRKRYPPLDTWKAW